MLGHPLLSLPSRCSVHPLRPLHHVHRHGEAAGETPGKASPLIPLPQPGDLLSPRLPGLPSQAWGCQSHTPPHRLLTVSLPIPSSWKTWTSS